jgi:hypothetical protein
MTGKIHKPDHRTRELVSALALNGVVQSRVAAHVGISEPRDCKRSPRPPSITRFEPFKSRPSNVPRPARAFARTMNGFFEAMAG